MVRGQCRWDQAHEQVRYTGLCIWVDRSVNLGTCIPPCPLACSYCCPVSHIRYFYPFPPFPFPLPLFSSNSSSRVSLLSAHSLLGSIDLLLVAQMTICCMVGRFIACSSFVALRRPPSIALSQPHSLPLSWPPSLDFPRPLSSLLLASRTSPFHHISHFL
jgi:hypothetical protein